MDSGALEGWAVLSQPVASVQNTECYYDGENNSECYQQQSMLWSQCWNNILLNTINSYTLRTFRDMQCFVCFGCLPLVSCVSNISSASWSFFLDCSFGFLLRLFATTYSSVYKQVYNLWPYYFIFSTKQDCFSNQIRGSIMK